MSRRRRSRTNNSRRSTSRSSRRHTSRSRRYRGSSEDYKDLACVISSSKGDFEATVADVQIAGDRAIVEFKDCAPLEQAKYRSTQRTVGDKIWYARGDDWVEGTIVEVVGNNDYWFEYYYNGEKNEARTGLLWEHNFSFEQPKKEKGLFECCMM